MTYKESFIKFKVDSGVLKFGEFTLKSGRLAPYFINAGNYKTGAQLAKLGEFYAECIMENGLTPPPPPGPQTDRTAAEEVTQICRVFGVRDRNLVKPSIGEATRVRLRRMPWKILVHSLDDEAHLGHLYQLAR